MPGHVIVAEVIRHNQEDVGLLGGGQPLLCGGGEEQEEGEGTETGATWDKIHSVNNQICEISLFISLI